MHSEDRNISGPFFISSARMPCGHMLRDTVSCIPARTKHTAPCVTMTHRNAAACQYTPEGPPGAPRPLLQQEDFPAHTSPEPKKSKRVLRPGWPCRSFSSPARQWKWKTSERRTERAFCPLLLPSQPAAHEGINRRRLPRSRACGARAEQTKT